MSGNVSYAVLSNSDRLQARGDRTHAVSQLRDLLAGGQLDLGLEGQLGSHGVYIDGFCVA